MSLLNDNDLDRLSREAADQYDVESSTSGWEQLEQRLDAELPQRRRRRGLLLWWLLAGVLLLGGALWGTKTWNESKEKNGIVKNEGNLTESYKRNSFGETKQSSQQSFENRNPNHTAAKNSRLADEPASNATVIKPSNHTQTPSLSSGQQQRAAWLKQSNVSREPGAKTHDALPGNPNATQIPTNSSSIPYITSKQGLPDSIETVTSSNPVHTSSIQNAPDVPGIKPTPQTSITDSTQQKPASVQPIQTTTNKTKPLNLSSRKGSFYLTALAGLDFSNVKFSSAGRAGFNGGLQIGYYFTDRLSVNTGLIYNSKNYKARGKDITPKGPMVYYDIDKIEGGCSMIDIPINIRYDLGIKTRSRYFISAGVSSYLMDKEDYDYYFYNNAGYYSERNWKTNENSSYLFSILNFSAGIEKQLGSRLQFQAEPYLKVPVQGVGHGEIRLNSFGINLGLKYPFGKTGKR
ncbi:porin family protein [Pseudobacter ginsenosidimutans]|uniref:Outer membrane protein with beta-barrel domain n=1 Tax=Pseudobacter ginsenosidimutans TaxID=661488 RepID=A0A4Q7MBM3_9BACT|nr:porin family protein [Pseudobacter ginsenosidimutans]QEC42668.1 porin family protein [Pseudobacter ginsenosidimutans]RZS65181.1 outer membrane protein with beta-barrel domain [Pseudobacter ginsenosidimutans]